MFSLARNSQRINLGGRVHVIFLVCSLMAECMRFVWHIVSYVDLVLITWDSRFRSFVDV